jgi:outer membrane lipoprotein-sorting protein
MQRQQLAGMLQKKLPNASPDTLDRAARDFLDHLREASPLAAEQFATGRMDEDDLASRVDVFLSDHPELSGLTAPAVSGTPRTRVAELLKREAGIAQTDPERLALADRFLDNLGQLSGTARDNLAAGRMSDDELQSRVAVFAADRRAEKAQAIVDPAIAAVPAIVDSFEKANFGRVTDRVDAICYQGSIEEKGTKREFVMFKKRPQKLRIHIVQEGLVIGVIAYDGSTAWRQSPGRAATPIGGSGAESVADSARFDDPLIGYRERGADVRLESKPGEAPLRLRIREIDGTTRITAIDPVTFAELSLRTLHSDGGWDETRFKDYRKVGDLNVAYLQEQWTKTGLRSTTRISDVSLDPGLLDRFFAYPTDPNLGFMDFMGGLSILQAREKQHAAAAQPDAKGRL